MRTTEIVRHIGIATVRARASAELSAQTADILGLFDEHAGELRDGFAVQAGWAPFVLVACGGGTYDVAAPDFAARAPEDPGWTTDLTLALWVLNGQIVLAGKLPGHTAPRSLHFADTVLCYRGIADAERIVMSRTSRRDDLDDSGWYLDTFPQPRGERGPADFIRMTAFRTLRVNKHLARALLLPVGYGAIVSRTRIDAVIDLSTNSVALPVPL